MRKAVLTVVVAGLTIMAAPARLQAVGLTETVKLTDVQELIRQGDYQKAIGGLISYIQTEPGDAEGYNLLGYSYRKLGQFEKAEKAYTRALGIDPNHKGANEYLGELYLQTDRLPEAEEQLATLRRLCGGEDCEEYRLLAEAIAEYKAG
ncbi:MAG TPA: tetratricopeptide repeat protein [Alphaproteobacteria bacterium]|nr:tetratricopeptide repeat protein [Alphaproteobacteria bacterium]